MALIKTKVRVTFKEKSKEITDYLEGYINIDNVNTILPSGMKGILLVMMSNSQQHLIQDSFTRILKEMKK